MQISTTSSTLGWNWVYANYVVEIFLPISKKWAIATLFLLGFLPKRSHRSILENSCKLLSSINTGFDVSEVIRIKTFSPKVAGYHLEIKAFKCVRHSSGIIFGEVNGLSLWYLHFVIKIQRFKDQQFRFHVIFRRQAIRLCWFFACTHLFHAVKKRVAWLTSRLNSI